MAHGTMEAYEYVRQMDRAGRIADSPRDKIQKAATTLLCDTTQKRDFALPTAARASRILGPISRHLTAQIIPMIRNAARGSRPGSAVGTLRVLCNGMCTAKRFHVGNEEQTCRIGCFGEPVCSSHYNRYPLLFNILITIWRNAGVQLQGDQLFHDLITQTFIKKPSTWNRGYGCY